MSEYLRVNKDGVAVEEFTCPDGLELKDCFHPDVLASFKPRGSAARGWIWDGSKFNAPAPPPSPTKERLQTYASMKLRSVLNKGISVDVGTSDSPQVAQVDTDTPGMAAIARNVQLATLNPSQTFSWVQASGTLVLGGGQMQAIARAAYSFEQSCWAVLSEALTQIENGAIVTTDQILALPWPAN